MSLDARLFRIPCPGLQGGSVPGLVRAKIQKGGRWRACWSARGARPARPGSPRIGFERVRAVSSGLKFAYEFNRIRQQLDAFPDQGPTLQGWAGAQAHRRGWGARSPTRPGDAGVSLFMAAQKDERVRARF